MEFQLNEAIEVLGRTPATLQALLGDLAERWVKAREGEGTWSPFEVVGHLIHGERTDWLPRVEHILQHGDRSPFAPFDRNAQAAQPDGPDLRTLLERFANLRQTNLQRLSALQLTQVDLDRYGLHPELGRVTLQQLLATWVAHDLSHVAQVARVMARQYTDAVGPWRAYLSLLQTR
jgi:hypothetical protein